MATKAELEDELAGKDKVIAKLEKKIEKAVEPEAVTVEKIVKVPPLQDPSPVSRGQLYVESHPTLGITRQANVTEQSHGDGRIGDGATVVRS